MAGAATAEIHALRAGRLLTFFVWTSAAPQPQNKYKTHEEWLDSRTAPHPVQYT